LGHRQSRIPGLAASQFGIRDCKNMGQELNKNLPNPLASKKLPHVHVHNLRHQLILQTVKQTCNR